MIDLSLSDIVGGERIEDIDVPESDAAFRARIALEVAKGEADPEAIVRGVSGLDLDILGRHYGVLRR